MINLDIFKRLVRLLVGDKGIKMLNASEWSQFTDYSQAAVNLHNMGIGQMSGNGGNVDLKSLNVLHGEFNISTSRFLDQLTFGVDQNGNKVNFVKLFGEVLSAHPSMLPSICARFLVLWAIEHKINMKYREKYENEEKKYSSVTITNHTNLPHN